MSRYLAGEWGTAAPPLPRNTPKYYTAFLPTAANLSTTLRRMGGDAQYRYLTHAYVVANFLGCDNVTYPRPPTYGDGLKCPNASQVAVVRDAVASGDVYWHAFPHNAQPELMDAVSFDRLGVAFTHALADAHGVARPTVLSQRDVPGMTRGVVPLLAARGVTGITVGVNDGTPPPITPSTVDCYGGFRQVRTPFVWKDAASGHSVVVDMHPGGYGGITGGIDPSTDMPYYARDGTLCDCVGVPGLPDVMCYAWRGDNYGPSSVNETQTDFALFQAAFPNASVTASTPDAWFDVVNKDPWRSKLPVVTSEIGDTWMYGVASDPLKLARMRAMFRAYASCVTDGTCTDTQEPGLPAFELATQKLSEHTWGGCACLHLNITPPTSVWTVGQLDAARRAAHDPYYRVEEATWDVQRRFIDVAMEALTRGRPDSPLAAAIAAEFEALGAPAPNPSSATGYVAVPAANWSTPVDMGSGLVLGWNVSTGGINACTFGGVAFASAAHPLATVSYRSHSWQDAAKRSHAYNYNHGGPHPYHEPTGAPYPGMNATTTVSKVWASPVVALWHRRDGTAVTSVVLQLRPPAAVGAAGLGYGAPQDVWVNVTTAGGAGEFTVEAVWDGKRASRLLESIWLEMRPNLSSAAGPWRLVMDKLGGNVSADDVVPNGGGALHGVDPSGGVTFRAAAGSPSLTMKSLDAALFAPGANMDIYNFQAYNSVPAAAADGGAWNLYNNLYSTNYVLYYPWVEGDARSRFRFRVALAAE